MGFKPLPEQAIIHLLDKDLDSIIHNHYTNATGEDAELVTKSVMKSMEAKVAKILEAKLALLTVSSWSKCASGQAALS